MGEELGSLGVEDKAGKRKDDNLPSQFYFFLPQAFHIIISHRLCRDKTDVDQVPVTVATNNRSANIIECDQIRFNGLAKGKCLVSINMEENCVFKARACELNNRKS